MIRTHSYGKQIISLCDGKRYHASETAAMNYTFAHVHISACPVFEWAEPGPCA